MPRGLCILALFLAGCWSAGERAPWNRPNSLLSHSQGGPSWWNEMAKDARGDNMRMQGDLGKSSDGNSKKPRSSSINNDD